MELQHVQCQQKTKCGDARGAKGDQAVLDFASGKVTCGQTAQPDADGDGRLKKATMRGGEMQEVSSIEDDVELQQSGEKKEVRVPGDSQPQNTIQPDELALRP